MTRCPSAARLVSTRSIASCVAALVLTTAASGQCELAPLQGDDLNDEDSFGWSATADGQTLIIGAPFKEVSTSGCGAAYVFRNVGGVWTGPTKLTASDAGTTDRFAITLDVDGDTAIFGAPEANIDAYDSNGDYLFDAGPAYVFIRNPQDQDEWTEVVQLLSSDQKARDNLGTNVAIDGDLAAVSAGYHDQRGLNAGAVYVFERDIGGQNNWGERTKLTAPDAQPFDNLGYTLALEGEILAVGTHLNDERGNNAGAVYIFARNLGGPDNWGLVTKLTAPDAAAGDHFGRAIAMHGERLLVGAPLDDDGGSSSGAAWIFGRNTGGADNWGQIAKLTASDARAKQRFGLSVAIDQDNALVGAPLDDDAGSMAGAAYLFRRDEGTPESWTEVGRLIPSSLAHGDSLGSAVALAGNVAIVGASETDDEEPDLGIAYAFDIADCNSNGVCDSIDIAEGTSEDENDNGVPDECEVECPWDIDRDGTVGPPELAELLGGWGPNPGHPADFNGDGVVGPPDLAQILGHWGPCRSR